MKLTFGIMTTYDNVGQLEEVIRSIEALEVPHAEILVVGTRANGEIPQLTCQVQQIGTKGWTPVKKNLVAKVARYENLVLIHDYYLFDPSWYTVWKFFNELVEWDVASNPQYLITGVRHFSDWVLWDHPTLPRYHSLDHNDWGNTLHQYISGGFFLVKRDFLREFPFNEAMQPGSPEDVEWSLRIRHRGIMVCNPLAAVRHNKVHRDAGKVGFPFIQTRENAHEK